MSKKIINSILIVAVIAVLAFIVMEFAGSGSGRNKRNPYEYPVDNYKEVDSAMVGYIEMEPIKPKLDLMLGIALDKRGNLYVAGDKKVLVFDTNGQQTKSFSTSDNARCLCLGNNGQVICGLLKNIEIYDSKGNLIKAFDKAGEKSHFTSVATSDSLLFVADAGYRLIWVYNFNGDLIRSIGKKDSAKNITGFIIPSPYFDIAVTEDQLWAVNPGKHTIENYSFDGRLRSFFGKASIKPDGFSGCCNPVHFAILPNGNFVTSEKGLERVKEIAPTGKFLTMVAPPKNFEEGTTGLDMLVSPESVIYVLDPIKGLVRKFRKKGNYGS